MRRAATPVVGSAVRTDQAAARGRLGLALGAPDLVEAAFGEPYRRRVPRLEEFLRALVPMLATGSSDHHGDLITATTPVPRAAAGAAPRPPVYVGAMGPAPYRSAVRSPTASCRGSPGRACSRSGSCPP